MKTRVVVVIILLLTLAVLLTKNNDSISNMLLGLINPIKKNYKNITQDIENKSHSYLFQKEYIVKLTSENRILRKRLLEQTHYIKQVKNIYNILPSLKRYPAKNITIAETISYVKLNSFSQIILTKPKELVSGKIYGLIQGTVVAGTARIQNNQLYGYLTSNEKCRFSVSIGDVHAPGIAIGREGGNMQVKFVPKWYDISVGDKVVTSGLDNIFFADLPVGTVESINEENSYKIATIKTYNDIFHPKTFFLVNDPNMTLAIDFDNNQTLFPKEKECIDYTQVKTTVDYTLTDNNLTMGISPEHNETLPVISSIPNRIDQTQEEMIEPEEPSEVKKNTRKTKKKHTAKKKRKIKTKPKPKRKTAPSSFDIF